MVTLKMEPLPHQNGNPRKYALHNGGNQNSAPSKWHPLKMATPQNGAPSKQPPLKTATPQNGSPSKQPPLKMAPPSLGTSPQHGAPLLPALQTH